MIEKGNQAKKIASESLRLKGWWLSSKHCTSNLKADVFLNKKLSMTLHV